MLGCALTSEGKSTWSARMNRESDLSVTTRRGPCRWFPAGCGRDHRPKEEIAPGRWRLLLRMGGPQPPKRIRTRHPPWVSQQTGTQEARTRVLPLRVRCPPMSFPGCFQGRWREVAEGRWSHISGARAPRFLLAVKGQGVCGRKMEGG